MKHNIRVLGIDPGLARLGWAIIENRSGTAALVGCGCVETTAGQLLEHRLQTLHERVTDIIREYRPDRMAVEKLFFTKNVTTGIAVAHARGVLILAAAEHGLPVDEYTPTSVKSSVTGDGRADKRQMGRMIQLLLNLTRLPKHDDTVDAIAIALCGSASKVLH